MVNGGKYGFMRQEEEDLIDRLTDKLKSEFGRITGMEVGVMGAGTTRGLYQRGKELDIPVQLSGVDFEMYRPNPTPDVGYKFYAGDSLDVWREIPTDSKFNFLFIDACHCVVHSSQDFLHYSPFVETGGYILWHDTALPIGKEKQQLWPQDHSYAGKPPSGLGVREGLKKLGLLDGRRTDFEFVEEVESFTGLMGMMLYRRILPYQ